MGKKYLDTKKDSLEQSILGVWKTAVEEGSGRMDGRTTQYKEHRKKLESARTKRESTIKTEEVDLEESAGLQLKMAFDDAGIKIKGVKSGKLVVSKKDKKEVEKIIAKQMKKPADAKRVLGSQIVFEDKGSVLTNYPHDSVTGGDEGEEEEEGKLAEKGTAYPATVDTLRKIVKDKQHQTVMFKSGKAIVDLFTASAMVQVYDALKKPDMKKTFEKMITDKAGFMKTQAFAMKMIGK